MAGSNTYSYPGNIFKMCDPLGLCENSVGNNGKNIDNEIINKPRIGNGEKGNGSGAKVDYIKPIYAKDEFGRTIIAKEFPNTPQAHGFNNIVDNYAGDSIVFPLERNATLYQLEGSLNGIDGRFEWITQNGNVTHRMFVEGGTINGVPIKK